MICWDADDVIQQYVLIVMSMGYRAPKSSQMGTEWYILQLIQHAINITIYMSYYIRPGGVDNEP